MTTNTPVTQGAAKAAALRLRFALCRSPLEVFRLSAVYLFFRDGYDLLGEVAEAFKFGCFFGHKQLLPRSHPKSKPWLLFALFVGLQFGVVVYGFQIIDDKSLRSFAELDLKNDPKLISSQIREAKATNYLCIPMIQGGKDRLDILAPHFNNSYLLGCGHNGNIFCFISPSNVVGNLNILERPILGKMEYGIARVVFQNNPDLNGARGIKLNSRIINRNPRQARVSKSLIVGDVRVNLQGREPTVTT